MQTTHNKWLTRSGARGQAPAVRISGSLNVRRHGLIIRMNIHKGQVFGNWTIQNHVKSGGNGSVYIVHNNSGVYNAIKILTKIKQTAYSRFKDEIKAIKDNCTIPGIIQITDSYLPDKINKEDPPWYTMPICISITSKLNNESFLKIIIYFSKITYSLSLLHEKNIYHRDIKPDNLLVLDEIPLLADFGLVRFPEKDDLTGIKEVLGPKWTMAPEVRRCDDGIEWEAADIYSLAKTLWIIITKIAKGFDGQYNKKSTLSISNFIKGWFLEPLEELLEKATDNNPKNRPSSAIFYNELLSIIKLNEKYEHRNPAEWISLQKNLFPGIIPTQVIWTELSDILNILNILGSSESLNHMFFPGGGGLDLEGAYPSHENGCIELNCGYTEIIKPTRLIFQSFPGQYEWNYFRIETDGISPSGVYNNLTYDHEEVTEIAPCRYIARHYWDQGTYNGKPLPETARVVSRHFKGNFLIFQKTSEFNKSSVAYDDLWTKLSLDQFNEFIVGVITKK